MMEKVSEDPIIQWLVEWLVAIKRCKRQNKMRIIKKELDNKLKR